MSNDAKIEEIIVKMIKENIPVDIITRVTGANQESILAIDHSISYKKSEIKWVENTIEEETIIQIQDSPSLVNKYHCVNDCG